MKPHLRLTAAPRLGLGGTRSSALALHWHLPHLHSPAVPPASRPSVTHPAPKEPEPEPMPLPHRGRGSRVAGSRVASTSLPRATAHSPRRAGRGAPSASHAQRLTRRRHSSEQVPPPGPEPQADFRSGKWLQERAGGDARDSRQAARAGMGSRHRSVSAVPVGQPGPSRPQPKFQFPRERATPSSRPGPPPSPRDLDHLEPAASQPS